MNHSNSFSWWSTLTLIQNQNSMINNSHGKGITEQQNDNLLNLLQIDASEILMKCKKQNLLAKRICDKEKKWILHYQS